MSYHNAYQMAKALVSYISSDERVWREVRAEFPNGAIGLDSIRRVRLETMRQRAAFKRRAEMWGDKGEDPIHCREYANRVSTMDRANHNFVSALMRELCA